jgi:hypothetical protein
VSRRICREIDDHEWVSDGPGQPVFCQACGLNIEDATEEHSMDGLDEEDEE